MERERPGPGDMKCLEPAMPEASDTPENSGYINQEISLFAFFLFVCLKTTTKNLNFLVN